MNIEQERGMLLELINRGRIILNGAPLTAMELSQLQQAVLSLYDKAKEAQENTDIPYHKESAKIERKEK
uniref:Uncharacterized protein n=1 Tax=viral metagenome TaxID=1070528 RepID=A0A6M3J5R1_9ZZZZ